MMKKKLCVLFSGFVLLFACVCPSIAFADSPPSYVLDEAHLLTESQVLALEEKASDISEKYGCGLYILTVDDFTEYTTGGAYSAATSLYLEKDLGLGNDASGQLLMLSMADRDFALIAHGYGNTAFTTYGNEYLRKKFLDDFADDDWYGGFEDYLDTSARLLKTAQKGKPFDRGSATPAGWALGITICSVVGFLIAWAVLRSFKSALKSVYSGETANEYVLKDGLDLNVCTDQYTHTTQTRVYIEPAKSSSGSGSSSSSSSGGFTGSSGKF